MGKVISFSPEDGGEERGNRVETEALSQEEFISLIEPLKEGLKRLYPSQVRDVLGMAGFGEKNGKESLIMGVLMWLHQQQSEPIASTFLAVFINDRLEKISFLEAKNNYWDWKLLIDTYQTRFNTKRMFEELKKFREDLFSGNL